ncbi:cytochrome P450 [Streptomyces anulatus]|uniref:cytochrome P450 n=1 Tax=Streptomyces anulatus TaxID=1892 RepID=UPI001C256BCA|nr:cytochrome P450 [Streptomyces anulatus]
MPSKNAITNTYDEMARDRTSAVHSLLSSCSPLRDEEAGSWFVADHETAKKALALPGLLPRDSENATADLTDAQRRRVRPLELHLGRWLAFSDRKPQRDLRQGVRRALRPGADPARLDRLHGAAHRLVPRPLEGSELVADFITPFTVEAVTDLLGAEPDSGPDLLAWGADLVAYLGLDRYREEVVERALDSLARLELHVAEWTRTARGAVPDAIRSALRHGATGQDATAAFAQLLTGGVEPTRSALVTGAVSLTSVGHPEAFRRAPEGYVSEVLRVASPFHFAPRTAGSDLQLRGTRIPAGARVSVVLCAANHDPARFASPESIDPGRPLRDHLAFGHGRHFCAGAGFAEEMLSAGLEALMEAGLGTENIRVTPRYERTAGMTRAATLTVGHGLC